MDLPPGSQSDSPSHLHGDEGHRGSPVSNTPGAPDAVDIQTDPRFLRFKKKEEGGF